jgi:hypothetical protein
MHRRAFLAAAATLAAGCGRRLNVGPGDPARIEAERRDRDRHLELLSRFRVPPTAARTTPPPPADVLAVAPELKPLIKVAVRLHPRYSDEPKPDESKLGGQFWWPAGEPWPTCDEHHIPLAPVLQLRVEDAPPNLAFLPGTDLLQLLWCPREHLASSTVWRKRAGVTPPLAEPPAPDPAFLSHVPVPCRFFPERVAEFPPPGLLPEPVRGKLAGLRVEGSPNGLTAYGDLLSACPGTKAGGYPWAARREDGAACEHCRWPMDFLLAVGGPEWGEANWKRWMPAEEQAARSPDADRGYGRASGLAFERPVNVFVCRRCDGWPVRVVG